MKKILLTITLLLTILLTGCIQPSANTDAETALTRYTEIALDYQTGIETDIEAVCDGYFIDELYDECVSRMNNLTTDNLVEYTFTISNVTEVELTDEEKADLGLSQYDEVVNVTYDIAADLTTSSNEQLTNSNTNTIAMVIVNGIYIIAELD